ncbi:zinc phosphodiesterase ELAC protein 2 [Caerostris extrusa]|uniref:ribonuclease Z n=1 Tax=Caerostris extrusa TaxID=172846 RepID=A0AAV4Q369_CAEEX|nr:zinc phosphodiesterase ELAC protein 2 [Caerostris extrusa]
MLVVECPSEKFLEPFVSESQFQDYQAEATDPSKIASLVVHFTPSEILKSPLYQKWMQRFPSTTCHLILNEDCSTVNSTAVHKIQHQLNLLHPQIFSLLHEKEEVKNDISSMIPNTIQACTLERYNLRPFNGIDENSALKLQPDEFIEEAMKAEGFEILLRELKYKIEEKRRHLKMEILKSSEKEYILMDCGEGTYGQILRLFGDKNEDLLLHLSVIFISHMHADHHLGLITILKERKRIFNKLERNYEKIRLIGPMNLKQWLKHYSMNFENVKSLYKFVECSSLEHDEFFNLHFENTFQCCPDLLISTVPVNHCQDAHGIIVSSKSSKWKLVYSGDTEPCNRLVIAGKDCSLLIHEATMEDDLATEAAVKRHCRTCLPRRHLYLALRQICLKLLRRIGS